MTRQHRTTQLGKTPSGLDVAEINVLMNLKQAGHEELQRIIEARGVGRIDELDELTVRNFLAYLRTL